MGKWHKTKKFLSGGIIFLIKESKLALTFTILQV